MLVYISEMYSFKYESIDEINVLLLFSIHFKNQLTKLNYMYVNICILVSTVPYKYIIL